MSTFTGNTINAVWSHIWDGNSTINNSGNFDIQFNVGLQTIDLNKEIDQKLNEILNELRKNPDINMSSLTALSTQKQELVSLMETSSTDGPNLSLIEKTSEFASSFSKATENISSAVETSKKLSSTITSMLPILIPGVKALFGII